MHISVIIPAYNEEKRIIKTLEEIFDYCKKSQHSFELIVVNDGSKDKTKEVVEKLIEKISNLKLINFEKNYGKGFAVRQGLSFASGEYYLFMDADNSTSIKELNKFFPYLNKYDIIIASRSILGSNILVAQPFYRKILGYFFRFFTKIITWLWEFEDTQCGFKLLNAKSVKNILPKCRVNGFAFDVEMLMVAKKMGYKIKEVPVTWKNDLESKVNIKGMIVAVIDLIKIGWTGQFLKFALVGLLGTLINFMILYFLTDIFKIYYMFSAFVAFLVAMTTNFVLNNGWTFKNNSNYIAKKYLKFFVVSVFALIVNLFFLYFFTEKCGFYYLISQIFAILPSVVINFLGNKFWTFEL